MAPLDANTLAKLANGICDNLLVKVFFSLVQKFYSFLQTCTARAWDMNKPFLVAPAMNTQMWEHFFTSKHLANLESLGYKIILPIQKKLACGETGFFRLFFSQKN